MKISSSEKILKSIWDYVFSKQEDKRLFQENPITIEDVNCIHTRINLLIPRLAKNAMTGGPNTAINLVSRLADQNLKVRIISCFGPEDKYDNWIYNHIKSLNSNASVESINIFSLSKKNPLPICETDIYIATWWKTAYLARYLANLHHTGRFIYLIQDFEPGFYPFSENYALANATYGFDYIGLVNEPTVAYHLEMLGLNPTHKNKLDKSIFTFWPAVERSKFDQHDKERYHNKIKKLIFYARPSKPRNLYNLGISALTSLTQSNYLNPEKWKVYMLGEPVKGQVLSKGITTISIPWAGYDEYLALLSKSDVVLSLMLSPHTSYPPLEAASAGAWVVTNSFGGKTKKWLQELSDAIVPVETELNSVVEGLKRAIENCEIGTYPNKTLKLIPETWDDSFKDILNSFPLILKSCLEG